MELSEVGKTFEGVEELMVREQFTNSCPRDGLIFLKERKPRNLEKLAQMAKQYLDSHNKKLSSKTTVARQNARDGKLAGSGSQRDVMRCLACDGRGHRVINCSNRASTSWNELNSRFRRSYCYRCGSSGHDTKDCRNLSPRTQSTQRLGGRSTGSTSTQNRQVACAMQMSRRTEEKEAERGMDTLELKTGEKIKVLNGACMEAEIKDNLPVTSGKVGNNNVEVLRDSRCNGVIVKRKLVDEADFIEKVGYMMTVNRTLIRAPISRIEVDTPLYTGTVEAMCMKDPLFDLIIGNVPGARKPNDPNPE